MENKETVCAVVVTYNRKNLLKECLEALIKQTRPIQAIYLIDNASTDGTPDLLLEKDYIKELPPKNLSKPWEKEFEIKNLTDEDTIKLYYVRMHENTGGAGGFHEGVKRGYERGYDWLWLMDDDGLPKNDCLEILLSKKDVADFLAPLVVRIDKKDEMSFGLGKGLMTIKECQLKAKDGILENVANPFNGILISKKLVQKIGYPKKEMFIWGDEIEYQLRTVNKGFNVVTVVNAIHYHPKNKLKRVRIKGTKWELSFQYDYLRDYCYVRNEAYNNIRYRRKRFIKKIMMYTMFFLSYLDIKGLLFYLNATIDGIFGKWGKEKRYLK